MARKVVMKETTPEVVETEIVKEEPVKKEPTKPRMGKVVDCSDLNVRKGAGIDFDAVCQIKVDSEVEIQKELGEWYKVKTEAGIVGYCMARYIK